MNITEWNGYTKKEFQLLGYDGFVVFPEKSLENKRWVWRAEFFGAFDYADKSLLEKGWCIAYYCISNKYGNPESVKLMKEFHDFIVKEFALNSRADMFGFSRGGLYAVNYAAEYPGDISTLYLDAPVLKITSWPGMLFNTRMYRADYAKEWEECKECYHLTDDQQALEFRQNPIDKAADLVKNNIPVIIVAGDSDKVVDYSENAVPFAKNYEQLGGTVRLIVKPNVDHHPHSLEDPTAIVDFIIKNALL